ncbi:hypothetical protein BDZ97DRAFT_1922316 [Flammula alnicola]|nr:hypothetical protein BDZ97DRAFT_1922316 [Flammula alnicola]
MQGMAVGSPDCCGQDPGRLTAPPLELLPQILKELDWKDIFIQVPLISNLFDDHKFVARVKMTIDCSPCSTTDSLTFNIVLATESLPIYDPETLEITVPAVPSHACVFSFQTTAYVVQSLYHYLELPERSFDPISAKPLWRQAVQSLDNKILSNSISSRNSTHMFFLDNRTLYRLIVDHTTGREGHPYDLDSNQPRVIKLTDSLRQLYSTSVPCFGYNQAAIASYEAFLVLLQDLWFDENARPADHWQSPMVLQKRILFYKRKGVLLDEYSGQVILSDHPYKNHVILEFSLT